MSCDRTNAGKWRFQNQPGDRFAAGKVDRHRRAKRLPNEVDRLRMEASRPQVRKGTVNIGVKTGFGWLTFAASISPIVVHENIRAKLSLHELTHDSAITDVSSISMTDQENPPALLERNVPTVKSCPVSRWKLNTLEWDSRRLAEFRLRVEDQLAFEDPEVDRQTGDQHEDHADE